MSMNQVNWKRPLALAIILFVLGSVAYWFEFKERPKKEEAEQASKKLFNLKDAAVTEVKIIAGTNRYELSCLDLSAKLCKSGDNSKWALKAPVKTKADDSNANALLSTLNNLTASEVISLKDENPEKRAQLLKEYGLNADQLKANARQIDVATSKGETVTAYLGGTHPIGDNIFTIVARQGKLDDSVVYLVPSYFKSNFDHDLTYWRDKKLFSITSNDVESFDIKSDKNHFEAIRKDGSWILKVKGQPNEIAGDIENIDNIVSALVYMTATTFISDSKTDTKAKEALKNAKSVLQARIQTKAKPDSKQKGEIVVFNIYQKNRKNAVAQLLATVSNADPLYELEAGARNRLDKDPKELRLAKLITSMERFTTKQLEFAGANLKKPLVLKNKDGKWLSQPENKEAITDKVQNLLDRLSGNRIKEFLKGSTVPSGEKQGLSVTLFDEKGEKKRELVFWKTADKLYARDRGNKSQEAVLVDPSVRDALPWDENFLFTPQATPTNKPDPHQHGGP